MISLEMSQEVNQTLKHNQDGELEQGRDEKESEQDFSQSAC